MSEKEIDRKSLDSIKQVMRDGEEPTEVLLSLVSSPLITLKDRGAAQVYEAKDEKGNPVVLAIFPGVTWDKELGLLPASVGNSESGVLAILGSVGSPGEVLAIEEEE